MDLYVTGLIRVATIVISPTLGTRGRRLDLRSHIACGVGILVTVQRASRGSLTRTVKVTTPALSRGFDKHAQ